MNADRGGWPGFQVFFRMVAQWWGTGTLEQLQ
jgi:hypothetical protein